MDSHLGFIFVCLLVLANILLINGDSYSDEVKNEVQDLDTQSETLGGQFRAYLGLKKKKKPARKTGRKDNKKKKTGRKPGKKPGRKPGKRPNKKPKSAKKKNKTNASKFNGNEEGGKETGEYNPINEEKLNNPSNGTVENNTSIEDIKNEIKDKIEEIRNHTHNSFNQTEKRNGTNGTTRNLSHLGFSISGGASPNEGNIFYNGNPICDDYWDDTDAGVFCRMLGYHDGTSTRNSKYGQVSHTFSMDDVHCSGDEISLLDCSHTTRENCRGHEGAGVVCHGFSISGGNSRNEGNIFYNGNPICDDYWDDTDAGVFCRMLGYQFGTATHYSKYGQVSHTFSMDDVQCNGDEISLLDCSHTTRENCRGHEGAGVFCHGFSIHGGPSRYEGNVFYNGRPICDDHWDNTDARVLCRSMGYLDGKATHWSKYGKVSSNFILDDVRCNGGEFDILKCSHTTNHNCRSHEGAGVICSGCHCLNHMSPYGFGNCKRYSPALGGIMCYVESSSTCTDKLPSQTEKGLYKSAVACSNSCKPTPTDYEGPFYVAKKFTLETKCIAFSKSNPSPGNCDDEEYTKEPIRIQGKILDQNCNLIDGAIIEYWQAAPGWSESHSKMYTMVDTSCNGPCIADMEYKGYRGWQTATNGNYQLNTVRPGIYTGRPIRHIHFKITVPGKDSLITQMYLPQDEPTEDDGNIYQNYIWTCQAYTDKPEQWAKKQKLDTCPIRSEPDGANYYYGSRLTIYNWDIVLKI